MSASGDKVWIGTPPMIVGGHSNRSWGNEIATGPSGVLTAKKGIPVSS